MKTQLIIKVFLLATIAIGTTCPQAQTSGVALRFTGNHTCTHVELDSILIENITQGGSTTLYYPDTVASLMFTDIGIVEGQLRGLYVSQNYPNPFSETTLIDVYVPTHDQLSLSVYDLSGRQICFVETKLEAGMHQFRFEACQKQAYLLVVNSRQYAQTRLMLQMGAGSRSHARMIYKGTAASVQSTSSASAFMDVQAKSSSSDFVFNIGDELRYTGYVTDFWGEVDHEIITDSPENDQDYLFDIANEAPAQPSEIAGETTVLGNELLLLYEVDKVEGVDWFWTVPDGWIISSGQGSHAIIVNAGGQSGAITVVAKNNCGTSPESVLAVTVQFKLSLSASPADGGIVDGGGTYEEATTVQITATPSEGWVFTGWTGDTDYMDDPSAASATVTMPAVDVELTATFAMMSYTLTLMAEPAKGGTVSGSGTYTSGQAVGVTATPGEDWVFTGWTGDTDYMDDPSAASATVTMPEKSISLTANFEQEESGWPKDTETEVVEVTNPATGKTWMDRNLGASRAATFSSDSLAYGDLYQWGRAADGHQKRNSGTTTTLSSSDMPGHGDFIFGTTASSYDWRSPHNDNLWQGVNGVNNPCPPGYRLPTDAELNDELQSWSSNDPDGAFASPLKLPVPGYRSYSSAYGGSLHYVGIGGRYWSSTVDVIGSWSLRAYYDHGASMFRGYFGNGQSVRCIKDW